MKLQRIFMLGLMVTSMALITSCSDGEDGEDGAPGAASTVPGPAGANGIACWDLDASGVGEVTTEDINGDGVVDVLDCQGATGDPGADGNANVRRVILLPPETASPGDPTVTFNTFFNPELSELTEEVLETHAVLAYAVVNSAYIPLPGSLTIGLTERRFGISFSPGTIIITEYNGSGWSDTIDEVHLILIEQSSVTGGGVGGPQVKAQVNVMDYFKANGVDVANYHEVMQHFGL